MGFVPAESGLCGQIGVCAGSADFVLAGWGLCRQRGLCAGRVCSAGHRGIPRTVGRLFYSNVSDQVELLLNNRLMQNRYEENNVTDLLKSNT